MNFGGFSSVYVKQYQVGTWDNVTSTSFNIFTIFFFSNHPIVRQIWVLVSLFKPKISSFKSFVESPWKLTFARLEKKLSEFFGTRDCISVFTHARHWPLCQVKRIKLSLSHTIFKIVYNIILSSVPRSSHWVLYPWIKNKIEEAELRHFSSDTTMNIIIQWTMPYVLQILR
jgi:hypothetical protein